ncbi:MAG: M48 family metalloprotease [Chloroflexi bacterium]|nr:M48 family metalloprotease [Chloroflexota bacterium]MBI3931622.1 M48 family metalloprotease [Chloroflexota bacterium]
MWLQTRMFLLVALLFAILYGVITAIGTLMGAGSAVSYIVLAFVFVGIQYLIGPAIVGWSMKIKWVSDKEAPELHQMVAELAEKANLPKPRVGISQLAIPNAFAFGRTRRDGRICVTQGILKLLSRDELKAVLGHEMAHIKHRDMAVITLISVIPLILYWIAWSTMWGGASGGRRQGGSYALLIGFGAFLLYFLTNLLVLYGSRIREYYADLGSVRLGNNPHHMATALYRLVYGDARFRGTQELKQAEGVRAFFVNDPARAWREVRELAQIDRDMNGSIDYDELAELRQKEVHLGTSDKMMELFTTHPNMLKRIKHLSTLAV